MSEENPNSRSNQLLFWGCFIALVTTAFAFITRTFLVNGQWSDDFDLDKVVAQELFGAGIWPFAISIIVFSLIIDRIGYKIAMLFSFCCYVFYAAMALIAYNMIQGLEGDELAAAQQSAYQWLYWGSVILGLGNGTVEAYINPVVATMFRKEKTKWLNILHAGWPGGLVLGGLLTIGLSGLIAGNWTILIYLIALPAIVFLVMLLQVDFPENERVASGTSHKEMLAEFGVLGALLASVLIFNQLGQVFEWPAYLIWGLIIVSSVVYWMYCRSVGRPILFFLCLIMMPLATTEIGTDGAITGILEAPLKASEFNPLWALVYTSAIMAVLRFWFSGPIVAALTPIGLLMASSALAILGLFYLATAQGIWALFIFATLYGFGKTFFWPTMLGVVSEQCPKGGALTLNAIAGIGMLTVGIVGGPLIGKLLEDESRNRLTAEDYAQISKTESYVLGEYTAVDVDKLDKLKDLDEPKAMELQETISEARQYSLRKVAIFPVVMLVAYGLLALFFMARGGYRTVDLNIDKKSDSSST